MTDYLLSICIPTYNRPSVVDIVSRYLAVDDSRFCIYVSDNCSNDGTYEKLLILANDNKKLLLNHNKSNLGFRENYVACMINAPSEYVIFTIDKDIINTESLIDFIDILQTKRPIYGYVPYNYIGKTSTTIYKKGCEALKNCAFLNMHPSGYFYNKTIFVNELSQPIYKQLNPFFAFPFDMVMGGIASEHDAMVISMPLITLAIQLPKKTLSYNEDNIFFGLKMRLISFAHYINRLALTSLSKEEKANVAIYHLNRLLIEVSIVLRNEYIDSFKTEYYNLKQRSIGYVEMLHNMFVCVRTYTTLLKKYKIPYSQLHLFLCYNRRAILLLKALIKMKIQNDSRI